MSSVRILHPKEDKRERERKIFARFALAARPDIDLATIESRDPSQPDIRCSTLGGTPLAFELVELCPEEVAKMVDGDVKRGGGVSFVWADDPTRRILKHKLAKTYTCDVPIDLLCYADGFLVTPDDIALDVIRATVDAEGPGPFRQIWLHGADGVYHAVSGKPVAAKD
jgi:hypothetical protein